MSKRKLILWLGVLVAVLPFLGLPASWKTVIFLISGVSIAWNSHQLHKHKVVRPRRAAKKPVKAAVADNAPVAPAAPVAAPFVAETAAFEKKEEKIKVVS